MIRKHRIKVAPYLFILPTLLFIFSFLFYPVFNVFYYSTFNYNVNKPGQQGFIALQNYLDIFAKDKVFYSSLFVSFKWVLIETALQLIFGLLFALLLNQTFRFRGAARAVVFAPWAISGVLTSMMWSLMYNENIGVINDLLIKIGVIHKGIAWIAGYNTAFSAVVVAELWRGIPFFAIMLLAGLQSISKDIYEACDVDGGNAWHKLIYITLPHLKNTIILSTLLRSVWEFNDVDLIYNITGGGPVNSTTTLTMYITRTAIQDSNFGYGSALSVIAFLILAITSILYLRLSNFMGQEN